MLNVSANLPKGFVFLEDIDDTIIQNMMYSSNKNFIGTAVEGYNGTRRAIITEAAAQALKKVQQDIKQDNYSLVVYDAYRPSKAVGHFVKWAQDPNDQKMKVLYYPYINKEKIFELGYVAEPSAHSSGSTVDLTIIELGKTVQQEPTVTWRTLKDGRLIARFDDNTVDMGNSIDCMDESSAPDSQLIEEEYLQKRSYLSGKMEANGWKGYYREWWHYTLIDEPYKGCYFDFDYIA
ncbi:M15 family metallopeptidase [Candidatus Tisiphia endosymbiont of Beris chalybata]|uniref:M15 family metallopeptidase n=1 Tax=Candidatus Tisiphia endosymbiont of Beris chalybata TaxID=3066262 RepID=UPI00312C994C